MNAFHRKLFFAVNIFTLFYKMSSGVSAMNDHNLSQISVSRIEDVSTSIEAAKKNILEKKNILLKIPTELLAQKLCTAFDEIYDSFYQTENILRTYVLIGNNPEIAEAARNSLTEYASWFLNTIMMDEIIYNKMKSFYLENVSNISNDDKYFLEEILKEFRANGIELKEDLKKHFLSLMEKTYQYSLDFENNVAVNHKGIWVFKNELSGLSEEFLNNKKQNNEGMYFIGVDTPTYTYVMRECNNSDIRDRLMHEYITRAYPQNDSLLEDVRKIRAEIASILGYSSYAEYEYSFTMAKTVNNVLNFSKDVINTTKSIAIDQINTIKKYAIENKEKLRIENHLNAHDESFVFNAYKKEKLLVNQELVSKYFPLNKTITHIFSLYGNFFDISFKPLEKESWWWSDDLIVVEVIDTPTQKLLGTIIFDLFPRSNKYGHACHNTIVQSIKRDNIHRPSIGIVVANFPLPQEKRDSLLRYSDVTTFCHELGHALHAVLGATHYAHRSGTSVAIDFVEMPSQLLELWMDKPEIIKQISSHYQTGESMPDDMIVNLCKSARNFQAYWCQRQLGLGLLSAYLYLEDTDVKELRKRIALLTASATPIREDDNFECAFTHLMGYGARYYSYLWSFAYSLDMFNYICQKGLLNKEVGKRLRKEVLEKGGSCDPMELIITFLERSPSLKGLQEYITQ